MARHIIATLNVWVDSDTTGLPSGLHTSADGKTFNMVIKPNVDKPIFDHIAHNPNLDPIQSIIAHEMGHFVARLTADPTHREASIFNLHVPLVPAEKKAWDIGEAINPQIDKTLRDSAMRSYRQLDQERGL